MTFKNYFTDRRNTLMPMNLKSDVLDNEDSRVLRNYDLKRAVTLGTMNDQESKIEYIDHSGRNRLITTKVIGMSDENAFLHNERIIPIRTISKVIV